MSLMAKIINLGVKMSGMKKKYSLPEKEFLAEVRKMNRTRGFYMPNDKKAVYKKHMVMGRECLIVQKTEKRAEKAILYFFGGGMMIGPDQADRWPGALRHRSDHQTANRKGTVLRQEE